MDLDKTHVESIEHPSTMIHAILKTVGLEYKKKLNDLYKIASKLDYETLYLEKADSIAALKKTVNHLEIALS